MGFLDKIGHSLSKNHTLSFLADPIKPLEKLVSTAHKDVKGVVKTAHKDVASAVSYGGKHIISDVDNISSSFANTLPFLIGGAVIVVVLMNNRR